MRILDRAADHAYSNYIIDNLTMFENCSTCDAGQVMKATFSNYHYTGP